MNMLGAMESIAPGDLVSVNQAIKLLVQDGIDQLVAIEMALSRYHRGFATTEGMAGTWETYDMLKGFCK